MDYFIRFIAVAALFTLAGCRQPSPNGDSSAAASNDLGQDHPLVGQQAPDFSLKRMKGDPVTLSQHRGQDVVILDFWATWCAPCRRIMPLLEKVAEEYRDRGVVLYSVNWGQPPEEIQYFLDDTGFKLDVLLDQDTKVGDAYRAFGLPMTVIIDRDGQVKAVFSGITGLTQHLRSTLDGVI